MVPSAATAAADALRSAAQSFAVKGALAGWDWARVNRDGASARVNHAEEIHFIFFLIPQVLFSGLQ
jgi:hypothetical protein